MKQLSSSVVHHLAEDLFNLWQTSGSFLSSFFLFFGFVDVMDLPSFDTTVVPSFDLLFFDALATTTSFPPTFPQKDFEDPCLKFLVSLPVPLVLCSQRANRLILLHSI